MSKIKELSQTYQDLSIQYKEQYGNIKGISELDEKGSNLLIDVLTAKLNLKAVTCDEHTYLKYHKPNITHQILLIKEHIKTLKFFQTRRVSK